MYPLPRSTNSKSKTHASCSKSKCTPRAIVALFAIILIAALGLINKLHNDASRNLDIYLRHVAHTEKGEYKPPPSSSFVDHKDKEEDRSTFNIFEWKCWDKCSCLPSIMPEATERNDDNNNKKDIFVMHQSYKSSDPQTWHWGWISQHQSWIDLHPKWRFIFWNDEQNALLANCTGYADVLDGRSGIQQADLSRLLYLHHYGGLYSDMDYIALRDHTDLFNLDQKQINLQQILLQGRKDQVIGFEWGYARNRQHPLWVFCLNIARQQKGPSKRKGCPIWFTGPKFLNRCVKKYFKQQNKALEHMVSYGKNDLMILEPDLVAPVRGDDFTSECGKWRNITVGSDKNSSRQDKNEHAWTEVWPTSPCMQYLNGIGAYAVTLYSHSWGEGLKC